MESGTKSIGNRKETCRYFEKAERRKTYRRTKETIG